MTLEQEFIKLGDELAHFVVEVAELENALVQRRSNLLTLQDALCGSQSSLSDADLKSLEDQVAQQKERDTELGNAMKLLATRAIDYDKRLKVFRDKIAEKLLSANSETVTELQRVCQELLAALARFPHVSD